MRAHRLSVLPLLFGLALPLSALAAPELSVRLNDQPLSPSWNALAADRYDAELELEPGRLHLVMPQAGVENTALAPFRRQPLGKDSAYRYEVPEAGRYRLIVETGASASLRLLPIKAAEPKAAAAVCRAWDGGAVEVAVGDVFRDGQTLRDALSGATTVVRDGRVRLQPAAGSDGLLLLEAADPAKPAPRDWRNAIVYFVLTDRFANGDPGNDRSYGREPDGKDEIGTFHGGDLKGLTERLDHIASLGVDALWISAPYEQIHGWVGGGDRGDFRHYGYHGYYALDFTQLDANMGSENDLRTLISAAHARGIRVLFDVVRTTPDTRPCRTCSNSASAPCATAWPTTCPSSGAPGSRSRTRTCTPTTTWSITSTRAGPPGGAATGCGPASPTTTRRPAARSIRSRARWPFCRISAPSPRRSSRCRSFSRARHKPVPSRAKATACATT
jgi:alpha-amylase